MSIFGLPMILFQVERGRNEFLSPGKVWSNKTGKVYDVEEPDA